MRTRLIDQEDNTKVLLTSPEQLFLDILAAEAQVYNTQHGQSSIGLGIVIVGSTARAALDESVTPGDVDVRSRAIWICTMNMHEHTGEILILI